MGNVQNSEHHHDMTESPVIEHDSPKKGETEQQQMQSTKEANLFTEDTKKMEQKQSPTFKQDTTKNMNGVDISLPWQSEQLPRDKHLSADLPTKPAEAQPVRQTASSLKKIGLKCVRDGNFSLALDCHRKALAMHKKESGGEQNEDTAEHYDNLGTVYHETGAANRAASYYHKALTIRLNLHGQDHLSTASSFDRIGTAYSEQGDYARALNFHHKAKHVKKKLLGREHEGTAKSFWNIGDVHYKKGDFDEAMIYFNKALDVQKRVLDDDDPDKATTIESIDNTQQSILHGAGEKLLDQSS